MKTTTTLGSFSINTSSNTDDMGQMRGVNWVSLHVFFFCSLDTISRQDLVGSQGGCVQT